ncbi:MAG TPA: hypothetical protein VGK93_06975 [Candidatus Eisenbacteria bacterium]|jgi:hypothetical protein
MGSRKQHRKTRHLSQAAIRRRFDQAQDSMIEAAVAAEKARKRAAENEGKANG